MVIAEPPPLPVSSLENLQLHHIDGETLKTFLIKDKTGDTHCSHSHCAVIAEREERSDT